MTCPDFTGSGASAIADALGAVDCRAGLATASAFSRLFGGDGMLSAALTLALTLYVGIFALGLLTGRTTLSLSALTPRMMGLGLALTFATSWLAYSQVLWNLLSGGPDWIAATMLGIRGSASHAFAARLDLVFQQVADAAEQARAAGGDAKGTTPADLLSYAALLLLLGTVGVLVCCRIALASLLAAGPVFIILALFGGTRGLFEGWLKATVQFALAPMFATLIGVGSVALLDPVVASLTGGDVTLQQAAAVFVAAAVHCALMAMALKLVSTLVAGWRLPLGGGANGPNETESASPRAQQIMPIPPAQGAAPAPANHRDERVRAVVSAVSTPGSAAQPQAMPTLAPDRAIALPASVTIGHGAQIVPLTAPGSRTRDTARRSTGAGGASPFPVKELLS